MVRSALPLLAAAAVVASLGAGCLGVISGPVDVEAIVRDPASGEYTLDVVTLHTPTDLALGEGVNIRYLRDFSFSTTFSSAADDFSAYPTIDAFNEGAREASGGRPPEPLLSQRGDVIVADDFDALVLLSSWVAFERTLDLFVELGDPGGVGSRPLVAALYGKITGLGLPQGGADNAAYLSMADAMFIDPVFWLGKLLATLPLSANEGIIAHELGHRMFFYAFYRLGAPGTWRRDLADSFDNEEERVLAGLNEGIADLFGIGVTGDPGFGNPSALGEDRDLESPTVQDFTYQAMIEGTHPCNEGTPLGNPEFGIYCLGTVFALTVWEASDRDPDILRATLLPALVGALSATGERTEVATEGQRVLVFDHRWLLEEMAVRLDGGRRTAFCAAAENRFAHTDPEQAFLCP